MKSVIYTLSDSFNSCDLSRHRSLITSIKALRKHSRRLKKHGAYITYAIRRSDGRDITRDEMLEAHFAVGDF